MNGDSFTGGSWAKGFVAGLLSWFIRTIFLNLFIYAAAFGIAAIAVGKVGVGIGLLAIAVVAFLLRGAMRRASGGSFV